MNESEELAYHFNFDASRVLILKAIDIQPENPKAYHHLSRHYLWYYLGSKNISEYYKFLGYSDSALTRAERLEDINSDDAQNLYLLGNIFKQRSMAYAENHKTMDAFWAARDAVGYYEDVLDVSPTHFSAYGGIGIFEYALSFIPSFIQWALPVTGLSADKNEGFAKLEKAYKNGNDDKVEYMFHIAKLFDEHLADYGKAISILESLVSTYPENSLFHYQLGLEFIKLKNLDKAKIEMEKVIEINHPKFAQTNSFANFLIGDIYFYQNQFDKAIEFYLNFLNSSKTIDYTGIASLRVALCYHFSEEEGNTEAYRRYLKLASNGNLEIEDDVYADEESKLLLKYGVTKQKENLIKLENIYNIGKYDDVISNFTKKRNSFQDVEMRGLALLYLSSSLIEKMKLVEAQKIAEEIISLEVNRNKWIKPMALFNLAKIKYKQKDYYRIEGPLVEAEDANEFGKQNLIQSYINGLRRKVKQK
ncbi:MAG: tetratricopeptide repeat protein [Melioribacteraceae bacterium]